MDKQEFLDALRISLNGKVSYEVLNDSMNYYEEYINTEMRMGKSLEQVMATLGDPRLIARTIVQTKGLDQDEAKAGYSESVEDSETSETDSALKKIIKRMPGWVWLILLIVLISAVIRFAFRMLVYFWPVILVVVLVIYLFRYFNGGSR